MNLKSKQHEESIAYNHFITICHNRECPDCRHKPGDDYETVKEKAEQKFGPSYESSHDIITYHDIGYGNIYWANLAFLFQYDSGRSYLKQIMFINSTNTASDAKAEREA